MRTRTIKDAFYDHKRHAKVRGIKFLITFEEWVEWWIDNLGSWWFLKRGNHRGQYVMGRKGDQGPYAPGNVECITQEANTFDRHQNVRKAWARNRLGHK